MPIQYPKNKLDEGLTMQKATIISKNGLFLYSGEVLGRFTIEKKIAKGNFSLKAKNSGKSFFVMELRKKPFSFDYSLLPSQNISQKEASHEKLLETHLSAFHQIQIGKEKFFFKVLNSGFGSNEFSASSEEEELDNAPSLDYLSLPYIDGFTTSFEHRFYTWRSLKPTSYKKINLDTFSPTVPTLIQIPRKDFKLKTILPTSDDVFFNFMKRTGLDPEKASSYIDEMNYSIKKSK